MNTRQLYDMFVQINVDCAASGDTVVPFTDTQFYGDQLMNLEVCRDATEASIIACELLAIAAAEGYALPTSEG